MTDTAEIPPTNPSSTTSFVRPVQGRMIAGVCAGIAERWQLDVTLVRVLAVVLMFASGVGVAAYIAMWLLTPSADGPAPLHPGGKASALAARIPAVALVLIGAAIVLALVHSIWSGVPALVVLLLLAAVVVGTRRGRVVTVALLVLLAAALAVLGVFGDRMGSRDVRVASAADLQSRYDYGAGRLRLDLSALQVEGVQRTDVRLGRGDAVITVPSGSAVLVHARTGLGEVTVDGHRVSGVGAEQTRELAGSSTDTGRLVVDVIVGVGSVDVRTS